jgi:hypothetical protein
VLSAGCLLTQYQFLGTSIKNFATCTSRGVFFSYISGGALYWEAHFGKNNNGGDALSGLLPRVSGGATFSTFHLDVNFSSTICHFVIQRCCNTSGHHLSTDQNRSNISQNVFGRTFF